MLKLTKSNLKWWVIVAISPCLAIIYLDQTAVAVTLPQLQRDFGISEVMQQWVVNAYLLTLAILIVIGGRLSDIFGNRRSFLFGLSGFLLSSILCGIAPNGAFLIASRAIQGIFGAILIPNTSVVVINAFPAKERGKAMGVYVGSSAIFLALGPLIGGFFTEILTWRLVYLINLPLGLFSMFIAMRVISRKKPQQINSKIDWYSATILAIATGALVTALMEAVDFGWTSPIIIGLFLAAIISYGIFFIREKANPNPLIDLQILREKMFLIASTLIFCINICVMTRLFWSIFFQIVLDKTPIVAGLMTVPSTAMAMIFAPIAGQMLDRYGPRMPVISGLFALVIGLLWISIFISITNYWMLLIGTMFVGIGISLASACIFTPVISIIAIEHRGTATGLYNQIRQIGGTFGVAAIGATITNIDNRYFHKIVASENLPVTVKSSVDNILANTQSAQNELASMPHAIAVKIQNLAMIAYANAFRYAMIISCFFAIVAFILALKTFKNIRQQ